MALSASALKELIISEFVAQGFDISGGGHGWADRLAAAVANAVVAHITSSARAVGDDSNNDSHSLQIQ